MSCVEFRSWAQASTSAARRAGRNCWKPKARTTSNSSTRWWRPAIRNDSSRPSPTRRRAWSSCIDSAPRRKREIGTAAPAFVYLGQAIQDCSNLANQVLRQITGVSVHDTTSVNMTPGEEDAVGEPTTNGEVQSHRAAYEQIDAAAEVLRRLEPHSPVPYLVKRAVALGRMPFPALIKQLVREDSILTELYREFGISSSEGEDATKGR